MMMMIMMMINRSVAGSSAGGSVRKAGAAKATYLHKPMSKDAANELAEQHLEGVDGRFFLRPKAPGNTTEYVLLVIYKGKPTQHLVVKGEDGVVKVRTLVLPTVTHAHARTHTRTRTHTHTHTRARAHTHIHTHAHTHTHKHTSCTSSR
jgi:hypothetical protein